jgi:hypothetical protein
VAPSDPAPRAEPVAGGPSLREVLGGRGGAVDASVPVAVFVVAWLVAEGVGAAPPVAWAAGAALVAGIAVATVRFVRGERPRAVLLGLLGVVAAAGVALWTGRAVDFFLLQMVGNAASALVWAVSIVIRWPLLGVVVGTVLGQRTRWRRDPALLRAYQRASWMWVGQYIVRLAVFTPLYLAGAVVALGVARIALTAPLVFGCIVVSWWVLRAALPPGHPGVRHPQG